MSVGVRIKKIHREIESNVIVRSKLVKTPKQQLSRKPLNRVKLATTVQING